MIDSLLQSLSMALGLGKHDLLRIIDTAPKRYKVYQIPKRRGGLRTIAQPSRELKEIQRFVLENLLVAFPVHQAATGYVRGKNIAENARAHVASRVVLKLDFTDFFPSIKVRDWERYAKSCGEKFGPGELRLYSRILFWGKGGSAPHCLSIGAPTSPILSNILLFDLDSQLAKAAGKLKVNYTRYADDITASGSTIEDVTKFETAAKSIVRKLKAPRLTFNEDKRGLFTMAQRRMVTGLVLTPTQKISIGRERKRLISVMLHKALVNKSDSDNRAELKGLLGFCLANEPDFVSRMRSKYGDAVVDSALKFEIPQKGPPLPRR